MCLPHLLLTKNNFTTMITEFSITRRVEFSETDLAGIMHFTNFYRWMESAEHAFLRERGIESHDGEIGWPRVNASADFKKPIKFGDLVRVRVSVSEVRTRSVCYSFEFFVNDDDTVRATGEMISVCVKLATMKAIASAVGHKVPVTKEEEKPKGRRAARAGDTSEDKLKASA